MKRTFLSMLTLLVLAMLTTQAQVTEGGQPYSIIHQLGYDDVPRVEMPETPIDMLRAEDI